MKYRVASWLLWSWIGIFCLLTVPAHSAARVSKTKAPSAPTKSTEKKAKPSAEKKKPSATASKTKPSASKSKASKTTKKPAPSAKKGSKATSAALAEAKTSKDKTSKATPAKKSGAPASKKALSAAEKKKKAKLAALHRAKNGKAVARGKSRKHKRRVALAPLPVPTIPGIFAVGRPSHGALYGAAPLAFEGEYLSFLSTHHKRHRNFGTPALVSALEQAARFVESASPGLKTKLGDLSAEHGGKISGHASHQNGLDADVALFYRDTQTGKTVVPGFVTLDAEGRGADGRYLLDSALMWRFVEGLLRAEGVQIQYVFLYAPLIEQTLEAGRIAGASDELLLRADAVLAQPGDSSPHAEHMHVRIFCPKDDPEKLCQQSGPRWPWVVKNRPLEDTAQLPDEAAREETRRLLQEASEALEADPDDLDFEEGEEGEEGEPDPAEEGADENGPSASPDSDREPENEPSGAEGEDNDEPGDDEESDDETSDDAESQNEARDRHPAPQIGTAARTKQAK